VNTLAIPIALLISLIVSALLFHVLCRKKLQGLREPDSHYYGQAEQELNDGAIDKGLWAKALVNARGSEDLRKIEYMKLRAEQLQKINDV